MDYISIILNLITLVFYIVILLFLIEIKKRMNDNFALTFIYLLLAVIILIISKIFIILEETNLLIVNNLSEILTVLFSISFFLGVYYFYKNLTKITDSQKNGKKSKINDSLRNIKAKNRKLSSVTKREIAENIKIRNAGRYIDLTKSVPYYR